VATNAYRFIDEASVRSLLRELGNDVPAGVRFLTDFVTAWHGRALRLLDAADRNDPEDTMTVLLSIHTASAMLGATVLSSAAVELQQRLAETRQVDAPAIRRLVALGSPTCYELNDLAHRLEPPPA
jgi:hypothetical protein